MVLGLQRQRTARRRDRHRPPVPTRIGTATDWTAISAGASTRAGSAGRGTLWCWGYNGYGRLGDGTTTDRLVPTRIGTAADWIADQRRRIHTCGLRGTRTLWCWG